MPDQIFFFLMSPEKFLKGKCSFGSKIFKNSHFGSSVETQEFPQRTGLSCIFMSVLAFLMHVTLGVILTLKRNLHNLR